MTRARQRYRSRGKKESRRGFTFIELLIVIGIFVVITGTVVFIINPTKVFRKSRDAIRVSDVSNLNQAISLYQVDYPGGGDLGRPKTVYVSIPDPNATTTEGTDCLSLGLPPPDPSDWAYHCSHPATVRNVDSTGWIPLNFSALSAGQPLAALPVDPANTTSSSYYAYSVEGGKAHVALVRGEIGDTQETDLGVSGTVVIGFIIAVGIIGLLSVLASLY